MYLSTNKFLLVTTLLIMPLMTWASDTSMTMTADVVATPCSVDTDASKLTVEMGDYYADELALPESKSGYITFPLKLKDCPENITKVVATFTGTEDPDDHWITMFKNTGTATNASIALKGSEAAWIGGSIRNGTELTQDVKDDHTVSWPMEAQIVSPSGSATPGTLHVAVTVNFTYQ